VGWKLAAGMLGPGVEEGAGRGAVIEEGRVAVLYILRPN
jgi:hypothetical protein